MIGKVFENRHGLFSPVNGHNAFFVNNKYKNQTIVNVVFAKILNDSSERWFYKINMYESSSILIQYDWKIVKVICQMIKLFPILLIFCNKNLSELTENWVDWIKNFEMW